MARARVLKHLRVLKKVETMVPSLPFVQRRLALIAAHAYTIA
jgi:hypothetical protein